MSSVGISVPLWMVSHRGQTARKMAAKAMATPFQRARLRVFFQRSEEHTSELQSRFDIVCLNRPPVPTRRPSDLLPVINVEMENNRTVLQLTGLGDLDVLCRDIGPFMDGQPQRTNGQKNGC